MIVFLKFRKVLDIISLNIFLAPSSFRDLHYTDVKPLNTVLEVTEALFVFIRLFSVYFIWTFFFTISIFKYLLSSHYVFVLLQNLEYLNTVIKDILTCLTANFIISNIVLKCRFYYLAGMAKPTDQKTIAMGKSVIFTIPRGGGHPLCEGPHQVPQEAEGARGNMGSSFYCGSHRKKWDK